jgi:SOS-response transcriptional repressor LexA
MGYFRCMNTTKEGIKAWLASHPNRDRFWLADKCDVEKKTVDNWLSSPREIPPKAILIIESLMRIDEENAPPSPMEIVHLPVECNVEQFDLFTRAYKASECDRFAGWITTRLDDAARSELRVDQASDSIVTFPEVPLLRAAAGIPILADAEHVEPDCDLGPGRFLLELRGDSMEPRFRNKQRVVLRDKATLKRPVLKYGELYCFIHEGAATFKHWAKDKQGRKVLRSLNPEHEDILADEQTEWIGWFDPKDNESKS